MGSLLCTSLGRPGGRGVVAGTSVVIGALLSAVPVAGQQTSPYHAATAELIARGRQALAVCNGIFVSGRTLEQIYAGELRADGGELVPADGVSIDRQRRAVAVGIGVSTGSVPVMRAAYREGVGCVVMAPHQTVVDIDSLPELRLATPPGDPATIRWPDGDLIPSTPFPADVRRPALEQAGNWAFDRTAHGGHAGQVTLSLLVVHRGRLLYERYAPGVGMHTRTRTWSTAKSIASTLVGIAAGQGLLELDARCRSIGRLTSWRSSERA